MNLFTLNLIVWDLSIKKKEWFKTFMNYSKMHKKDIKILNKSSEYSSQYRYRYLKSKKSNSPIMSYKLDSNFWRHHKEILTCQNFLNALTFPLT